MIILHILLWILFGIAGLLLLILISPVQYALQWKRDSFDAPHWLRVRIKLLLGLLHFQIVLENHESRSGFGIFGIEKAFKAEEKEPKKEETEKKKATEPRKKAKKVVSRIKWVKRYFTLADFKHIAARIFQHLWRWLKPSFVRGNFQIGTGDPALTGILFGWYCSTGLFGNSVINISPEFVHTGLCGDGTLRGRLILIDLLRRILLIGIIIISIYMRKKFQLIFSKPTTNYAWRPEGGSDV